MTQSQNNKFDWLDDFRNEQIKKSTRSPGLAAWLSFFFMGTGQIYAGHIDRGIMLFAYQLISAFIFHSICTNGMVYSWLIDSVGPHMIVFIGYVYSVIYILVWIYNIKDAYYRALFSCFRDWMEIERVLLPSLGVPSNLLLSNPSVSGMIEDKREPVDSFDVEEIVESKDNSTIIASSSTTIEAAEIVAEVVETAKTTIATEGVSSNHKPQKTSEKPAEIPEPIIHHTPKRNDDTLFENPVSGELISINGLTWDSYLKEFFIVITVAVISWFAFLNPKEQPGLSISKDFSLKTNNTETAKANTTIQPETAPIIVSADLKRENQRIDYPTVASPSSDNSVVIIQGHRRTTIQKRKSDERIVGNPSRILYEAPIVNNDENDVQMVMMSEEEATLQQKLFGPSQNSQYDEEAELKKLAEKKKQEEATRKEAELKVLQEIARLEAEKKAKAEAEAKALGEKKAREEAIAAEIAKAEAEAKALAKKKAREEAIAAEIAKAEAEAKALAEKKAREEAIATEIAKAEAEAKALAEKKAKEEAIAAEIAKAEAEAKALAEKKAREEAIAAEIAKAEAEAKTLAEKKANEEAVAKKKSTNKTAMTPEEAAAVEKIRKRGAYEFYRGNYKAALPFYFEVLKHKRDAESFEMVGIIFEKLNKLPDAYEAYEHAFELGLTTKKNVINLGLIGEKIGKYEKAQKYLEMAIDKNPVRADVVMSYARILDKQGEFKAAGEVLAILRDSTTSYAIKQAAEAEYLKMKKKHEQAVATGSAVD